MWEDALEDAFEMFDAGTAGVGSGVIAAVVAGEVGSGQEFHAHRGDLRHLRAGVPLEDQRQRLRLNVVEGMPCLVQQRFDIARDTDGIHKDERTAPIGQARAVPAGAFPLAAVEVEQMFVRHQFEVAAERRIEPLEDRLRALDQRVDTHRRV